MGDAMTDAARLLRYPDYELLEARFVEHRFGMHAHDSLVLAVVEDGIERLRVGRDRWLARPGDLVMIGPGEAHDGAGHDRAGFAYRAVYPTRSLVAGSFGLDDARFDRNVVSDAAAAAALRTAHRRLAAGDDPLAGETALLGALGMLLRRYAMAGRRRRQGMPRACAAAGARELIESRLTERLSLLELARACDATPLGLLRAFQDAYGMPPHRYQLQRRIQLARRRLRGGADLATDLATLAAELGFADQSHFSRVFKSVVGVPPGAYRRAARA